MKIKYNLPEKTVVSGELGLKAGEIYQVNYSGAGFVSDQNYDLLMTLLAMQGMLNRSGPFMYLDHDAYFGRVDHFNSEIPKCTQEFRRYYADTRQYKFLSVISDPIAAVLKFLHIFNGIILYNGQDMKSRVAAINIASLNFCLPVSIDNYNKFFADTGIAIIDKIDLSVFSDKEVYGKLIKELIPLTDRTGAYSLGYNYFREDKAIKTKYHILGLDYCIKNKNFIFLMSCNERERGVYDFMLEGSPAHYGIFCDILKALKKPAAMMGWSEGEWRWALTSTWFGHYVYCTDWAPNLSFHAAVKPLNKPPYRNKKQKPPGKVKNKVYISIVANEGDTPKMVTQLYNNGWLCKRRGDYPANWAINPNHAKHFPALLEYYYVTAKDNDYFTMAPNGIGYNNVRENDDLPAYLAETKKINKNMRLTELDLWYANFNQIGKYFELMPEINGISIEPHFQVPEGEAFSVEGKPVIRHVDRLYYWYGKNDLCSNCKIDEKKLNDFLESLYDPEKPKFVPVYGYESDLIDNFADFCDTLDKERFEIVNYHALFELAKQAVLPHKNTCAPTAAKCIWSRDCLTDKSLWEVYGSSAEYEFTGGGLKLRIPANAPVKESGFRNDMLSSTAVFGQSSAMLAVKGVVIPGGASEVTISTSYMSEGSDWMFWTYGDYDGFGLLDKWEPFWKPKWKGARSEEIPKRVRTYAPNASEYLIICVEGKPGDEIVFDRIEFR